MMAENARWVKTSINTKKTRDDRMKCFRVLLSFCTKTESEKSLAGATAIHRATFVSKPQCSVVAQSEIVVKRS